MLTLTLLLVGGGIDALALYLCPLSLIAPMSGVTIVTNSIFMTCFLGEQMSGMQVRARVGARVRARVRVRAREWTRCHRLSLARIV